MKFTEYYSTECFDTVVLLVVLARQKTLAAVDIAILTCVQMQLHLLIGKYGATAVVRAVHWTSRT